MTHAHAIFIVALTLANIAGALWLLWWTRRSPEESDAVSTTGHVWDEDLTELNNPLPRWWLWLFIITIAFAGVYLTLYPGLGLWPGTLGWSSRGEHETQSRANAQRIEHTLAAYSPLAVSQLEQDPAALAIGRNLFLNNCAACHGSDGGGAPGFPNLTDHDWLYGGDPDTVVATISNGRAGVMPAWGGVLGTHGVDDVLAYVLSLQKREVDVGDVAAGKVRFAELCSACHGPDARGNPLLGAPNLTDAIWLHGGAAPTVYQSIDKGRNGAMPAHLSRLGETRIKLLAAYVLSMSAPAEEAEETEENEEKAEKTDHGDAR